VVTRAKLLRADPASPGGMAAIATTEDRVARYISTLGLQNRVSIAVFNAPENNVISGNLKDVDQVIAMAKRDGLRATKLVVDQGNL